MVDMQMSLLVPKCVLLVAFPFLGSTLSFSLDSALNMIVFSRAILSFFFPCLKASLTFLCSVTWCFPCSGSCQMNCLVSQVLPQVPSGGWHYRSSGKLRKSDRLWGDCWSPMSLAGHDGCLLLFTGVKLTLSALVDGKSINAGGHKLGLALELEA